MDQNTFIATTAGVPLPERIDYWADRLSQIWGHIQIEPTNRNDFGGLIKSVKGCQLVFNEIAYRGHNIHRTASNIAMMKQGFHVLAFPMGNPWEMKLRRESFTLQRGYAYLLCNTVPYKSDDKAGYDTFNVIIPTQLLHNRVPALGPRYVFPLDSANTKANILQDFVSSVYARLPFGDDDTVAFMENHLLNLLAFLLNDSTETIDAGDSSVKLAHRRRIMDFIAANLADEQMSPETIARHHGVSVSYLHRVFKPTGRTVVEEIRSKRLQAARRLLETPGFAGLSVTEIAYRVGFKHPSDFSRAFKQRYGNSPRDFRPSKRSC
jgi:AraC-like DNA-binding protein